MIGPVVWMVNTLSYYYTYTNEVNNYGFFTLSYCVWYTYGALLQQVLTLHWFYKLNSWSYV